MYASYNPFYITPALDLGLRGVQIHRCGLSSITVQYPEGVDTADAGVYFQRIEWDDDEEGTALPQHPSLSQFTSINNPPFRDLSSRFGRPGIQPILDLPAHKEQPLFEIGDNLYLRPDDNGGLGTIVKLGSSVVISQIFCSDGYSYPNRVHNLGLANENGAFLWNSIEVENNTFTGSAVYLGLQPASIEELTSMALEVSAKIFGDIQQSEILIEVGDGIDGALAVYTPDQSSTADLAEIIKIYGGKNIFIKSPGKEDLMIIVSADPEKPFLILGFTDSTADPLKTRALELIREHFPMAFSR